MFDNILNLFKRKNKEEVDKINKEKAKERLHLVLMQDRANVSADFLDLMKQEIIDVIKKYIDVDEDKIDVKLTNKLNGDGTTGAPALYANIPIKNIKKETRINSNKDVKKLEQLSKESNKNVATTVTTTQPNATATATPTETSVAEKKIEPKKEDHSIVIDVPESKAKSAAFVDDDSKKNDSNVDAINAEKVKTEENNVNATTNTVANTTKVETSKSNNAINTTTVNTVTNNTPVNTAKSVKVEAKTETSNQDEKNNNNNAVKTELAAKPNDKTENDDKNEKNGNNEKEEAKVENKPVKMNKKKTTFFENVLQKKK